MIENYNPKSARCCQLRQAEDYGAIWHHRIPRDGCPIQTLQRSPRGRAAMQTHSDHLGLLLTEAQWHRNYHVPTYLFSAGQTNLSLLCWSTAHKTLVCSISITQPNFRSSLDRNARVRVNASGEILCLHSGHYKDRVCRPHIQNPLVAVRTSHHCLKDTRLVKAPNCRNTEPTVAVSFTLTLTLSFTLDCTRSKFTIRTATISGMDEPPINLGLRNLSNLLHLRAPWRRSELELCSGSLTAACCSELPRTLHALEPCSSAAPQDSTRECSSWREPYFSR